MPGKKRRTRWYSPIRHSQGRWIMKVAPRTCSRWSRPRRPNCFFWRCFCDCSNLAGEPPSSCRMEFSSEKGLLKKAEAVLAAQKDNPTVSPVEVCNFAEVQIATD